MDSTVSNKSLINLQKLRPITSEVSTSNFEQKLKPLGRILEVEGYHVWCCSPIYGPDGRIHVFYSRWRNEYTFSGWVSACEVAHAVADLPEGPYEDLGVVLKGSGANAWDSWAIHNPTVQKVGDKYALFYMGADGSKLDIEQNELPNLSTAEYEKYFNQLVYTKRIGLAIADNINGPWRRVGDEPVINVGSDGDWDDAVVSNPSLLQNPNGEYWLYYKGWDWDTGRRFNGNRKYGLAIAKSIEGPYKKHSANPIIDFSNIGERVQCEDAYTWFEPKDCAPYKIIMRDMGFYNHEYGLYMESSDGLIWQNPQVAYKDAGTYFDETLPGLDREGRFERPQLLINSEGVPTHLFCAYQGGRYGTCSGVVLEISKNNQSNLSNN
tara:strand:- start:871 stop:2010 length:1140 start_codon:yes stop_codon:yes gene_type:complete